MVFWRKRRTETYTTSDWDDGKEDTPPKDPIAALFVLPKGPHHVLAEVTDCYGPKKWITVGASSLLADIQLFEPLKKGERPKLSPRALPALPDSGPASARAEA